MSEVVIDCQYDPNTKKWNAYFSDGNPEWGGDVEVRGQQTLPALVDAMHAAVALKIKCCPTYDVPDWLQAFTTSTIVFRILPCVEFIPIELLPPQSFAEVITRGIN